MANPHYSYDIGFTSGSATKESLADAIYNIDPTDSPVLVMLPKGRAKSTTEEWLTDTLKAVATATGSDAAAREGSVFSAGDLTNRVRTSNWTQISRKDIEISNTALALDLAGASNELVLQIEKGLAEMGRNIEASILRPSSTAAQTGATNVTRLTKSISDQCSAGNYFHADSTVIDGQGSVPTSNHPLIELMFNGALEQAYNDGGKPETIVVSTKVKRQISSNFKGFLNGQQNYEAEDKRLTNVINIYESDFGVVKIVLDRHCPQATNVTTDLSGHVFCLEMQNLEMSWFRPVAAKGQPEDGDVHRAMIVSEWMVKVFNPNAHVIITGVQAALSTDDS